MVIILYVCTIMRVRSTGECGGIHYCSVFIGILLQWDWRRVLQCSALILDVCLLEWFLMNCNYDMHCQCNAIGSEFIGALYIPQMKLSLAMNTSIMAGKWTGIECHGDPSKVHKTVRFFALPCGGIFS